MLRIWLVIVARTNCDLSAQRLGELALGSSAGASSSDREKSKNEAWVRSSYGRLSAMLMVFYASRGDGDADE